MFRSWDFWVFEYIFWTVNHLVMKFGKLIDIVINIVFRKYFILSNLSPSLIFQLGLKGQVLIFQIFY